MGLKFKDKIRMKKKCQSNFSTVAKELKVGLTFSYKKQLVIKQHNNMMKKTQKIERL